MKARKKAMSRPNWILPKPNEMLRVFNPLKLKIKRAGEEPKQ